MINKIDVKIITAKNDKECKHFCSIALSHRLFVPGWQLNFFLKLCKDFKNNCDISLAYINNVPIGVSLLLHDMPIDFFEENNNQVSVFVRKKYRNLGIGTKLLKSLKDKKTKIFARKGIEISKQFYEKQNVYVLSD